jgi:uncharacterized protein YdcH (DUF465 family)
MLHEYRDIITHMKENASNNAHFIKIFDEHNELDEQIKQGDSLTDMEIETLKKKKLKLKDEAYNMIMKYKKENDL